MGNNSCIWCWFKAGCLSYNSERSRQACLCLWLMALTAQNSSCFTLADARLLRRTKIEHLEDQHSGAPERSGHRGPGRRPDAGRVSASTGQCVQTQEDWTVWWQPGFGYARWKRHLKMTSVFWTCELVWVTLVCWCSKMILWCYHVPKRFINHF